MNNDLISRSALLEDINFDRRAAKVHPQEICERFERFCDYAEDLVEQTPAVDAEVVRHGRWIPCYEPVEVFVDAMCNTEIINTQTGWICSECSRHGYGKTLKEMPYCHCGAKMDGEVET